MPEPTAVIHEARRVQAAFTRRLRDVKDAWQASVELAQMVAPAPMALHEMDASTPPPRESPAVAQRLDVIRRVVERQGRRELREAYRELWRLGRLYEGVDTPLDADMTRLQTKLYRQEQQFFVNMLTDQREGTYTMDLDRRIDQYGAAVWEAFFWGRITAQRADSTYFKWMMSPAENCEDCLHLSKGGRWKNGIYSAAELIRAGLVPKCEHLACYAKCNCGLLKVPRPTAPPKRSAPNAATDLSLLRGPRGNSFRGGGRTDRERLEAYAKRYRPKLIKVKKV